MSSNPIDQHAEAERWAGEMGEKWNTHHKRFEGMIAPLGQALIESAHFQPGEKVIDVGCGAGVTSLEIAKRVGPTGSVTGLDISPVLVNTATARAKEAGLTNFRFVEGDASKADIGETGFDCLFSRFGIMFFPDPYGAFEHLHGFVKPGGRAAFSCWGPQPENAWVMEVMGLVMRYIELPPPEPRAPGPFAFADQDYLRDIMAKAGFKDVTMTAWRGEQCIGGPGSTAKTATEFLTEAVFVGEALKDKPEETRQKVIAELEALLARHEKPEGVQMQGMAWIVSATA